MITSSKRIYNIILLFVVTNGKHEDVYILKRIRIIVFVYLYGQMQWLETCRREKDVFIKMFVYFLNDSFEEEGNIEHFLDNLIC